MQKKWPRKFQVLGSKIAALILLPAGNFSAQPLSPRAEWATFKLADDRLEVELVAAEPDVISPVAITWDAAGRLFVAEMLDYPNEPSGGRIRLLEDRDGDQHYERAVVFADQLPFPNSVLPWGNGLLVTAAPNLWYLEDHDRDGVADERTILFTGFGEGNQQLRANGLYWGLDNWVYGANGRNDGEITRPGDPQFRPVSLRKRDFRFQPGTAKFEALPGQSQFGGGRDDWGNRFLSWNTIPARHQVIAGRYLERPNASPVTDGIADLLPAQDTQEVFPRSPPPLIFNQESSRHFNALAGLTLFRGDNLGRDYYGNLFLGESLRNLVHRRVLVRRGVTFEAQRSEFKQEFLAASDPWFHPVNYATGPDGALYVVDFYRQFVEHPGYAPESLRGNVDWRTGSAHGRLWRVKAKNRRSPAPARFPAAMASLELCRLLAHPNGWWRDTAQRLLIERRAREVARPLREFVLRTSGAQPWSAGHALYTLHGLAALDPGTIGIAMKSSLPELRVHGIRLREESLPPGSSPADLFHEQFQKELFQMAQDHDARVRFQVALSLAPFPVSKTKRALAHLIESDGSQRWPAWALLAAAHADPWPLVKQLPTRFWSGKNLAGFGDFYSQLGWLLGNRSTEADLEEFSARWVRSKPVEHQLLLFDGMLEGLERSGRKAPLALQSLSPSLTTTAVTTARDTQSSITVRSAAVRIAARLTPTATTTTTRDLTSSLLEPEQPLELQHVAASVLGLNLDPAGFKEVLDRWPHYLRSTRRRLLATTLKQPAYAAQLLERLEQGTFAVGELDGGARQTLLNLKDPGLAERSRKLLPVTNRNRRDVIRAYEPALKLKGNPSAGAEIFAALCASCHALGGRGVAIGPDLAPAGNRAPELLLWDILDPNRQVAPDHVSHTLEKSNGDAVTGLIVVETASSITIRRPNLADEVVLRNEVRRLQSDGVSLMPEGLEAGMSPQQMADLLAFLRQGNG